MRPTGIPIYGFDPFPSEAHIAFPLTPSILGTLAGFCFGTPLFLFGFGFRVRI
jgi:hypothetical protein